MFRLCCEILCYENEQATKPKWVSSSVAKISIDTNITQLTDTATITIPKRIIYKDKDNKELPLSELIKRGNKIVIRLGYDDKLHTRFIGYVRKVKYSTPVVIDLDDSMWLLKQKPINDSWDSETLGGFIKRVIPSNITVYCDDPRAKIGAFRIKNSTPVQALEKLCQDYPVFATFLIKDDKPILHIGLAYPQLTRKEIELTYGVDIINPDNLEWRNAEDVKVKVVVKNKRYSGNSESEDAPANFGDEDGEVRTFYMLNADKESIEKFAKAKLQELKYTGYTGTLDVFGETPINKGDVVVLKRLENEGKYYVKNVKIEFGEYYHQTIELGGKAG